MLSLCTLLTECQGPYLMAEKVGPRSTTVFHGGIRNFDAPHLEGETWGSILIPWHSRCPYGGAGRGLSGMTLLCVWEMLGSMIRKILSSQWKGPLMQVWPHSLPRHPPHPHHLQQKGLIQTRQPCTVGTSNSVSSGRPCGHAPRHTFCPFPASKSMQIGDSRCLIPLRHSHWIIIHLYSFALVQKVLYPFCKFNDLFVHLFANSSIQDM